MAVLVTFGDRLITSSGRASWLKRPSVPLAQFGRGQVQLAGQGSASYLSLYETQPWVAATVNKLSRGIMDLPLRLYREVSDDGEVEPVHNHPLVELVKAPWDGASQASLKQKIAFPTLVHGNGALAKVRQTPNSPPEGLLPLDWRFLIPWTLDDGEVYFWESTQQGRNQYYHPDDVVHFAFEAGNGDLGVSPLCQLAVTLGSEVASQNYQASSFRNGARPSGGLTTPGELNVEQRAELREEIRAMFSGDAAFNVALLTGGMDWKTFSHSAVEAELIEQRHINREEIAAVYDVDPPLIGILDHATYSNVAEMHNRFYRATLRPWLTLITDTLNAQLLEPQWRNDGLFFAFDLSDVLRSDTPEEINAVVTAIAGGVSTPNEGRQRLRMRKSDNPAADELYMPSNNLTVMGEEPDKPDPVAPLPAGDPAEEEPEPNPVKANLLRTMERAAKRMAGDLEPWDRERFVRELHQDAPNAPLEPLADLVEGLIAQADGDPAACRRLAASRFQ